jgi:hypothetical protein
MPDSVSNVQVKKYTDLVLFAAQQEGSKTRKYCEVKTGVIGESVSFDTLGTVELVAKPGAHAATPSADPNHGRRWAQIAAYHNAIPVDKNQVLTMIGDPTSSYVKLLGYATGRKWDKVILDASIGTAQTGVTNAPGATAAGTETWPFTDRKSVSHRITESGTVGLTVAKLRQAKRIFDALSLPNSGRVLCVDAYGIEDLLETTEVTSSDYNMVKALVAGDVDTFLGFKFETVDSDLMTVSSSIVSAVAMIEGAVGFGVSVDQWTRIWERTDRSGDMEAYINTAVGAVRRAGERIVEVQYYQS